METNNNIIIGFANSLVDAAAAISSKVGCLADNDNENRNVIKTLNVLTESLRSQTVLFQSALDDYK